MKRILLALAPQPASKRFIQLLRVANLLVLVVANMLLVEYTRGFALGLMLVVAGTVYIGVSMWISLIKPK